MKFESPIEQRLLGGLALAASNHKLRLQIEDGVSWPILNPEDAELIVFGQVSIDGYRLDFVVSNQNRSVAIECDGHDFHERTKEQAQHDKARDRRIARTMTTLRFTGSEIHRDAVKCAEEIIDFFKSKASPPAVRLPALPPDHVWTKPYGSEGLVPVGCPQYRDSSASCVGGSGDNCCGSYEGRHHIGGRAAVHCGYFGSQRDALESSWKFDPETDIQ